MTSADPDFPSTASIGGVAHQREILLRICCHKLPSKEDTFHVVSSQHFANAPNFLWEREDDFLVCVVDDWHFIELERRQELSAIDNIIGNFAESQIDLFLGEHEDLQRGKVLSSRNSDL